MKISANKTININLNLSSEDVLSLKRIWNVLEDFKKFICQETYQQYRLTDFVETVYDDFTDFLEELTYRPASVETYLAEFIEEKEKEIVF